MARQTEEIKKQAKIVKNDLDFLDALNQRTIQQPVHTLHKLLLYSYCTCTHMAGWIYKLCSASLLHIRICVGYSVLVTAYLKQLWLQGCEVGSSTERTRTSITNSLKKKLADLMQEFTALRNNIVNQYRDVVDRRCHPHPTTFRLVSEKLCYQLHRTIFISLIHSCVPLSSDA